MPVQQAAEKPDDRRKATCFGSSSTVGVAVTIMVRNPDKTQNGCRIFYRDIGDYLSTQQKRQTLVDMGSIDGIEDWQTITPDGHDDWINQRDNTWETLLPLGHEHTKANKPEAPATVMRLYSGGLYTKIDPYLYSFDKDALVRRAEDMTDFYEHQRQETLSGQVTFEQASENKNLHLLKWNHDLKNRLKRNLPTAFNAEHLRVAHYRPFVNQWLYYDPLFIGRLHRIPDMFPTGTTPNQAIYITGKGASVGFSTLITGTTPDLHFLSGGQAFPRYAFPGKSKRTKRGLSDTNRLINPSDEHGRIDNITDWCLTQFQDCYNDPTITKDDIWAYLYGVLHAPDWRNKYANELRKDLPRIPFATDFRAFQKAGQQLIDLHLSYETCQPWPLQVVTTGDPDDPNLYRIDRTMVWGKIRNTKGKLVPDKTVLHINAGCRIEGIPDEANHYEVNGKTPLDWAIARLKVAPDSKSGIVNDANQWHTWVDDPHELIPHLQRLVRVSVETTRIVNGLPPALSR